MEQLYIGYIYGEGGKHGGRVELNGEHELQDFFADHITECPHMVITDALDRMMFESIDGALIYPSVDDLRRLRDVEKELGIEPEFDPAEKIRVVVVEPTKQPRVEMIPNTLEAQQELVGGYIECLALDNETLIVCNEEGKLRSLPINRDVGFDVIMGSFFVCRDGGDDFDSLTDEQVRDIMSQFTLGNPELSDIPDNELQM